MTNLPFLIWSQRCVAYALLFYKSEPFGQQVALRAVDRGSNFYGLPSHVGSTLPCSQSTGGQIVPDYLWDCESKCMLDGGR